MNAQVKRIAHPAHAQIGAMRRALTSLEMELQEHDMDAELCQELTSTILGECLQLTQEVAASLGLPAAL